MQDGWCRWSQAGTLFICFLFLRHSFLRNTLKLKAMAWMAMVETLEQFVFSNCFPLSIALPLTAVYQTESAALSGQRHYTRL